MDFQFLKDWAPVFSTLVLPCVIALVRVAWKISKSLEEMKRELSKISEHESRLDVHDSLATEVYGKPVSSKLISENKQSYPRFHPRKLREDH